MHDHNLDDLIIGSIEPENNKTKSFLTIIALLIIVMIVAIVLTRILLKTPNNDELAFEENITEMIAPELKLQETPKETESKKEPSLSNMIESEITPPAPETKDPVEKVEPKETLTFSDTTEENAEAPLVESKSSETTEETNAAAEETDVAAEETEEDLEETVQITQEYTHIPKKVEKPAKEIVAPAPIKKPVIKPDVPKTISSQTYYIQVGSFKTNPSTRFLSTIKNSGFNYTIIDSGANGSKKLLIGPYQDKSTVDNALIQVKDRINKSAFIIKK